MNVIPKKEIVHNARSRRMQKSLPGSMPPVQVANRHIMRDVQARQETRPECPLPL